MRLSRFTFLLPLLPLLLAGCGDDSSVISGTLLDSSVSGQVWIDEEVDRFDITNGSFTVEGARGDTIDLQFATTDGTTAWMRILNLPGGSQLTLDGIWLEGGRAFPTDARVEDEGVININGLRMGSLARVSESASIPGTLLAMDDDGESLIIRPVDEDLPDLRVAINEGTVIQGPNSTPSTLERLEFGDSVAVAGAVQGRYVMAAQLTLSQSATTAVSEAVDLPEMIVAEDEEAREEEREEERQDAEQARAIEEQRGRGNPSRGRGFGIGRRN